MLSAIASPVMAAKPTSQSKLTALDLQGQPMMDDFDRMLERRGVRVLVPYSRTLFFNDRGAQRGLTADILREFERWLNEKYKTGSRPITVLTIPVTRDQLFPKLLAGYGDLVAGNLTITDARQGQVNFSSPLAEGLSEVVVTGPASPPLRSLDDLAGQEIHVRRSSSYYESLAALNERFSAEGKPVMALRLMPDADIHLAEPNVHGGIKYMRHLIDYYFRDANFDEQNRTLFAFASYNAGPGRIAKLRREAHLRGLDPDTWFNNVEIVAARRIGQETVQYVRNIYKYYIAYRLQLDTLEMRKAAGEQFR